MFRPKKVNEKMPDQNLTSQDMNLSSGIAAFEAKNFSQAMALLGPLAEQEIPDAQYRLAIMYQNGLGMVRNELLAVKWMCAAANRDFALAQHGLGFMYLHGDCIAKNGTKAVHWFQRAAAHGLTGSQTTLAMMYEQGDGVEKNIEKAKEWYRRAGFEEKL